MKESPFNPQCSLNQRISLPFLALVFMMTWHFVVTESTTPIQFRGEVGGNLTIDCPFDKQRNITLFYLQKKESTGEKFVDGYHASRYIPRNQNKTRVDLGTATVHMYSLEISDSGDYCCYIRYSEANIVEIAVQLSITANYSKPKVTQTCSDGLFCHVTCASYGGYPQTKITWSASENPMVKVLNSSERPNLATMLFDSFSTLYVNCSGGKLKHLSCSVGEVTSDPFSVCTPKDPPDFTVVIAAICTVWFFCIIVAMVLWWKCKKGQRRNVPLEWRPSVSEGEAVNLNDKNGCEEAP